MDHLDVAPLPRCSRDHQDDITCSGSSHVQQISLTWCLHIFTTKLAFSTSVGSFAASLQSAYVAMAGKRRVSTNHSQLLIKASASFKMISLCCSWKQIQSGLPCQQAITCKPDKEIIQCTSMHQIHAMSCPCGQVWQTYLHSIGRNRWSCVLGQLFLFSGVVRQVTSDLLQSFSSCAVGATIFFLLMDQSQHTPRATAAWIGSDMGRMRNVDLQQVYNLQCYTAFTDKNMGSTSGTSETYQRWIAKSREDLIHPRWLAGFLPSTVCNTTHTKYMCIHIYICIYIHIHVYLYVHICVYTSTSV